MKLGVGLPSFARETHAVPPERFRRYARLADDYEFAGAWLIEHLGENPNYDTSLLDPLTTLSVVAGETETIPLGTSILVLPLRNPVLTAKQAVTLQQLSSGRLTLGLGTGYVESEFDAVGVPLEERSERYLEGIELMRRLFDEEVVTFDGNFYSVDEFRLEPNLGRPPQILAGGGGVDTPEGRRVATSVKRRLRFSDGWIAPPRAPSVLEADWAIFCDFLGSSGRDPDTVDKVALQYLHLTPTDDPDEARRFQRNVYRNMLGEGRSVTEATENWLLGTIGEVEETLAAYERQGFNEVILHPLTSDPAELERQLRLYRDHFLPRYS